MSNLSAAVTRVKRSIAEACRGLVDRQSIVELVVLCAVAKEHLLVVGPPGTAKSEAVRRIARRLDGVYFEYLLGRFTEPSELFGPVDLRKLKEGIVETSTAGMLPEAEVAFLDEVFLGSTAILNTLLGILNERMFRRGHTTLSCPMRVCVGAANRLPDDEQLSAFADRFLARVFVAPVEDAVLEDLLEAGWSGEAVAPRDDGETNVGGEPTSMADVDALSRAAFAMNLTNVRPALARAVRTLRAAGIEWSDRRVVRVQRLVAAAAVLAGRSEATDADLWPLVFALPTEEAQRVGRDALRDLLVRSENVSLLAAAAEGSLSPPARSALLLKDAAATFAARPTATEGEGAWRLQVEAIAREIDATFTTATMPEEISHLRSRVVAVLGERPLLG
ncbi:Putative 2-component regulator [Labilithrix luteola]|uniref:Putative 2-component regulator n=1 Tax=Labilithrix luteola TaxID=1391654 RepID=A0A0K1PZS6_9BACT|nr:AAA family ATPase [Labilithrix luteola]AKU99028.1 Putative 2-component regulator [Labilithrix luteola]